MYIYIYIDIYNPILKFARAPSGSALQSGCKLWTMSRVFQPLISNTMRPMI